MSANVFPLKPARSAGAFTLRADHVPSRTMRLESSRSVHEPLAASDASISAHHLPRKVPLVPAVGAPHSSQHRARLLRQRTGNNQDAENQNATFHRDRNSTAN